VYDAPIAEVSGACFAGDRLVLVGDSEPVLAWATWAEGPGQWHTLDVSALPGAPSDTGQFEAVEHLDDDIVVILCEEPALLVAVDLGAEQIVGSWHLHVDLKGLAKPWAKDPNSHGEGFFFGPDRLFIVKEKKPAAIVEFGIRGQESIGAPRVGTWRPPADGELTALAWTELDLEDVSDVCVVGRTYGCSATRPAACSGSGTRRRHCPSTSRNPRDWRARRRVGGWWRWTTHTAKGHCMCSMGLANTAMRENDGLVQVVRLAVPALPGGRWGTRCGSTIRGG
jgi:hypothetical protein